jgi:4-nitrophenyl phosphatase
MDGVLYKYTTPIMENLSIAKILHESGKIVVCLTNNATKNAETYTSFLKNMGLDLPMNHIFTSSFIASEYLKTRYNQASIFVIGEEGLIKTMKSGGFSILNEQFPDLGNDRSVPKEIKADFVIVGMDKNATYNKLCVAMILINRGAHFYATNDDANFPTETELWPGSGALVAFLARCCQQAPKKIFGKPYPDGILNIIKYFGCKKEECVMVGDRLETDILAGNRAGVTTLLVETGINTRKDVEMADKSQKPTLIFTNLTEMYRIDFES